ncbi:hypothetical protein AURANDRAFT_55274 [Aureococcus anophagefferens]|uniref:Cullin family profile domain-containing protein n=1 Tax=Aureococcus anophagefferens TaxID=44056 RepID=F0YKY7_AURAN|nr:hypothetical protein AURANDRAFT_55274 [Aureococcus anophagefferens]EGB04208.1 hypothetical protein AURANDRAFT_55274 [Aureococcus anophagefferens]|eukprot:XP_009041061.1 hypothetical protein AURANDRAFT_55274 [Aureococcus anophagefferens]
MCSNAGTCDHSKALYDRTKSEIENVLQNHVVPELKKNLTDGGHMILSRFSHHWENHKVFVKWMQQLFRHLDNGYVANSSISTITSVGLKLFFDIVFDRFKGEICDSLINAIDKERDGADIDPQLLRSCVEVFPVMGLCSKCTDLKTVQSVLNTQPDLTVYEADFETLLLERTSDYYARKSIDWLGAKSTPSYLRKAEAALDSERERVSRYLHMSSQQKLLGTCERELLQKHKEVLIEREQSGLIALLAEDRAEDLKRMFDLFRRISDGLTPMATTTKKFVQIQGGKLLQQRRDLVQALKSEGKKVTADDPSMINCLLALHAKMSTLVFDLFDGENQFQRALKEAFQDVINTDATPDISNVEMLVMHTDRVLSGKVRLAEEEVESCLEQIIQLFQFLSDKDLYAELYREQLAKRLLSRRSTAIHTEKSMIVKMKTQQGAPFTTKLEGMVNDFTLGKELDQTWSSHLNKLRVEGLPADQLKMNFSVQVLTQGFWPSQKQRELQLSREMSNAQSMFDKWYKERHSHRILSWIYALGDVIVKGGFSDRSYDMTMTAFQAMALLGLSSRTDAMSFHEIRDQMAIDETTGKRVLHSLSCGKYRLLKKTGHPRTINCLMDSFHSNASFSSKLKRFLVQMSALDGEGKKKVDVEIQQQRGFSIDATIVRILKARKRLSHQELVGEVIHQVQNFAPESKLIRQRVEGLIERERAPLSQALVECSSFLAFAQVLKKR